MATDALLHIQPRPEFAGILRQEERYGTGAKDDAAERLNGGFDRLLLQSGLEIAPSVMLLLCVAGAVTVGGIAFLIQEHALSIAIGAAIGGIAPIAWAIIARYRRQKQMLEQMPGMVGELARAARTGRSLEQCLETVARDTPAPLGTELNGCVRRLQMGISLPSALRDLPERTGLVSMNVLVMALVVHQQTGGDLVRVLDRLATTIRDRIAFLGRLRAATAGSRATAILMLALPPAIVAYFTLRDANYLSELMASRWGRGTTIMAIGLQLIGSLWVLRILKNSRRT